MRVVVAEDTMLTREGIVRLLGDAGIEVVGQVEEGARLLRMVAGTSRDVAIVDIRMPPTHTDEGLVAAQRIRAEHPAVGVLVLSQFVEPTYAMRLLEEHPERIGYLLKERIFDAGYPNPETDTAGCSRCSPSSAPDRGAQGDLASPSELSSDHVRSRDCQRATGSRPARSRLENRTSGAPSGRS